MGAESLKDVFFDALGLCFMYNLDKLGADLAIFSEASWPSEKLAWAREMLPGVLGTADVESSLRAGNVIFDWEDPRLEEIFKKHATSKHIIDIARCVNQFTISLLALSILVIPVMFAI